MFFLIGVIEDELANLQTYKVQKLKGSNFSRVQGKIF